MSHGCIDLLEVNLDELNSVKLLEYFSKIEVISRPVIIAYSHPVLLITFFPEYGVGISATLLPLQPLPHFLHIFPTVLEFL